MPQGRETRGTPSGGQFSSQQRDESETELVETEMTNWRAELAACHERILEERQARINRTYWEDGSLRTETQLVGSDRHRTDGPAIVSFRDGAIEYEEYFQNDVRHREDGPAFVQYRNDGSVSTEIYFRNGERHRDDGPARLEYSDDGHGNVETHETFYLNGERVTSLPFDEIPDETTPEGYW